MSKTLVICEKKTMGEDVAKAIGNLTRKDGFFEGGDWIVTWASGHLLQLAEPETYDEKLKRWSMIDLPFVPDTFKLKARDARARDMLKGIKALADRKDVDRVVNACDAGREGELIFAYVAEAIKLRQPVVRLWVSSLTHKAITDGFKALRDGADMKPLEEAARCRSEADWIVGMNATRAATIKFRPAVGDEGAVSLGRVQTPTLALLVKREHEIEAFVPETYFLVKALFQVDGPARYAGTWFRGKETRLTAQEDAEALVAKVQGKPGEITAVSVKEAREKAPMLYDLTTLQREANKRFGFSAERTLQAAQGLYEQHKALSYPRTSSRYLSTDIVPGLPEIAKRLRATSDKYEAAADYVLSLPTLPTARIVDDKKVSDHHAIIPTDIDYPTIMFDDDEKKIFDMVSRRFLAVFHPDAVFEQTEIVTTVEQETFKTKGKVLVEAGWRAVYGAEIDEDSKGDDDEDSASLPKVTQGQTALCENAKFEEKQTKPPARYNEGSLLGAMETAGKLVDDDELREAMKDSGLGTPATRAAIIETLIRRSYVERNGKELVPTSKGVQVIDLLDGHMLTSAELTGSWEKRLGEIEQGEAARSDFMRSIGTFTRKTVEEISGLEVQARQVEEGEWGKCPRCNTTAGGVIVETPKAYSCSSWQSAQDPGCGFVIWKEIFGKKLGKKVVKELLETGATAEKVAGLKTDDGVEFASQLVIDPGTGRVTIPRELEIRKLPSLGPCPFCADEGDDEEIKESLKLYGCTSYRSKDDKGCGFVIGKTVSGRKISRDEAAQLIRDRRTGELEGFTSRAGEKYSATLVLTDDKQVRIVGSGGSAEFASQPALGTCPFCKMKGDPKQEMRERPKSFSCTSWKSKEEPGCGFTIWKTIAGREISREEATQLVRRGKTELLEGFTSKKGSKFAARLGVDAKGKVSFIFDDKRRDSQ